MQRVNYVTPSLLNSWLYLTSHDEADPQELIDYLHRIERPQTEAQAFGCEFEDEVYAGNKENYKPYVEGGLYQVKIKKQYNDFYVVGIIDVLQPFCIYDVKTTKTYTVGKYYNTSQHKIYTWAMGIKKFAYLINEECYVEEYEYQKGQAEELLTEFMEWLKQTNLYDVWKEHWVRDIDLW